jgi:hypothetical protein
MALVPISLVRQRDHVRGPGWVRTAIERASVFPIVIPAANLNAGDIMGGAVLYDSEFLGAWFDQDGDEGTNGTAIIEKWDDATGSGSQTTISASLTVDAGAASLEWIAPLATGVELVDAGYKINLKTTGINGSPAGRVTCWFKLVDDLGIDG